MGTNLYIHKVVDCPPYEELLQNCQNCVKSCNSHSNTNYKIPTRLTHYVMNCCYVNYDLRFDIVNKNSRIFKFSQPINLGKRTGNIVFSKDIELKYFLRVPDYYNFITTKKQLEKIVKTTYKYMFDTDIEHELFIKECLEYFSNMFDENTMFGYTS